MWRHYTGQDETTGPAQTTSIDETIDIDRFIDEILARLHVDHPKHALTIELGDV